LPTDIGQSLLQPLNQLCCCDPLITGSPQLPLQVNRIPLLQIKQPSNHKIKPLMLLGLSWPKLQTHLSTTLDYQWPIPRNCYGILPEWSK